jgi:hypothetical protein
MPGSRSADWSPIRSTRGEGGGAGNSAYEGAPPIARRRQSVRRTEHSRQRGGLLGNF